MLKSVLPLMAGPKHGVSDKGASLLEQAMLESWNAYKNETTITHIADWLLAHKDKDAQDLGLSLFSYTKDGSYGRFFNGPSTVDLDNPFIVIEMEELKERKDLQAVVVQMLIVNITNKMFLGDRKTPFQIVFDEAWDLLQGGQGGSFMEMLARRLRKYRGGLVVGTQSLNDFYQSPGARAVFENSDTLCMLSQRAESIDLLKEQKRISMTPQKEEQLKSVKTKQGLYAEIAVITPQGYSIERLIPDPFSLVVYSTKPEEYAAVKDLKNQGLTMEEAVSTIVARRKQMKNPNHNHQRTTLEKAA
jgi:conjugal transfer ATP-binding protein TraC